MTTTDFVNFNKTAYCVLWVDFRDATINGFGFYSESHPTSLDGQLPIVLYEREADSFGDALDEMREDLRESKRLNPYRLLLQSINADQLERWLRG